ncbi:MAG: DNA mismatch repair protein MutS [Lachnospiraceae bacterium]|nr:DNA mismatch repair protein MutS [Lachnospiraceae bacterium]
MMQHYLATKETYKDCILFYRLGDFYEMFFDDAKTVSRELELTLTGKTCGLKERAPMCGVPFHSVDTYITRLVGRGYKVAICEQMEDPATAKGMVKREVVRIVTPGTNTNTAAIEESENNFLMCVVSEDEIIGISVADVTTGEYYVMEALSLREFADALARYAPKEILSNQAFAISGVDSEDLKSRLGIYFHVLEGRMFDPAAAKKLLMEHFRVASLNGLGLHDMTAGLSAAGALMRYLYDTQKNTLSNIVEITPVSTSKYLVIDSFTMRNLELIVTLREKQKKGSLLWVLDHTRTAMGARMLKSMIEQPLIDRSLIDRRLDAVSELKDSVMDRDEIREYLSGIYDLERLMCRVSFGSANPRDLIALKDSLKLLPGIRAVLKDLSAPLFKELLNDIDPLSDIADLIGRAIDDDAPLTQKTGGIIREGYSEEADELKAAGSNGKQWLAELEEKEREKSGIRSLKIKFNKVFGYSFEVSRSFLSQVPEHFIRKQTLSTGERFVTEELNNLADTILNAEEKLKNLEYALFDEVREHCAEAVGRIQKTARALSLLDCLQSLAYVAEKNRYSRPKLNEDGIIHIRAGRHPVVEKMLGEENFISNDVLLDTGKNMISIITGPNMAGKSTYMRQTALIVLMAHLGSFVPAENAEISIVDRIFTRVGASDDLSTGQSTFMVEMTEVANILRNATSKSLLILDEIGRGTSTFDGLSIAWAVVEFLSRKRSGARTLFATHYHELTELEGRLKNVNNYCFAVKEKGDDVVFLRKVVRGSSDRSYGIHVARLAGVPDEVVERSEELLSELTKNDIISGIRRTALRENGWEYPEEAGEEYYQLSLFDNPAKSVVEEKIRKAEISRMTPVEALNFLFELQQMLK